MCVRIESRDLRRCPCSDTHTHTHVRSEVQRAVAVRTMRLLLVAAFLVHASVARRNHLPHAHNFTAGIPDGARLEKFLVVDDKTGIQYNPYSKHHPGRHVCTSHKDVTQPVKAKQAYCKPTFKKYQERCNVNKLCTGVRLVYETAYKDVVTTKHTKHLTYVCCPGWFQATNKSHGCNKPHCATVCQNGGTCTKPDLCSCPKGFIGRYCEHDVDECKENKPCDQICLNTNGSFKCHCRENFVLQSDGQSCRKEDEGDTALEAKDIEYDMIYKRISKLESMFGETNKNRVTTKDLLNIENNIKHITKDVNLIQNKIDEVEGYKNDMQVFKIKLLQIEKKANKVDELMTKYDKMKLRSW